MEINSLALKDRYLNKDIKFLINSTIIEYDMKDAGLSLIQKYKLLKKSEIKELLRLNSVSIPNEPKRGKYLANVKIGKMQKTNDKLKEGLKLGFALARDSFITSNNLDESCILSIKKDAFFLTKVVKIEELDEFITFRKKNVYTGYLLIENIEIFYKDGILDIKNIGDDTIKKHKDYFLSFLIKFFKKCESSSKEEVLRFLRIFIDKYKRLELDCEYYIEFKARGTYVYKDGVTTDIDFRQNKELYDISYNYNILISLVQYML